MRLLGYFIRALLVLAVSAFIVLLLFLLGGCATSPQARGWPAPQLAYTHAATHAQADHLVRQWRESSGLHFVNHAASSTGSMRPWLHGGPREFLCEEIYTGRKFTRADIGLVATFDRGDHPAVMHLIAAVSADGDWLYFSGLNNPRSDGWHHRSKVAYLLRAVITLPALGPLSTLR